MTMKNIALVLIGIGMLIMFITGFADITHETVVTIGDDRKDYADWPPIAGSVLLVVGVVTLLGSKKVK